MKFVQFSLEDASFHQKDELSTGLGYEVSRGISAMRGHCVFSIWPYFENSVIVWMIDTENMRCMFIQRHEKRDDDKETAASIYLGPDLSLRTMMTGRHANANARNRREENK